MTPVRLEPTALRSRVKHSTTEPLRSISKKKKKKKKKKKATWRYVFIHIMNRKGIVAQRLLQKYRFLDILVA